MTTKTIIFALLIAVAACQCTGNDRPEGCKCTTDIHCNDSAGLECTGTLRKQCTKTDLQVCMDDKAVLEKTITDLNKEIGAKTKKINILKTMLTASRRKMKLLT